MLEGEPGRSPPCLPAFALVANRQVTESFGRNDAQVRALYAAIAEFDSEVWMGLVLASAMIDADPRQAEPEYRPMIERQHKLVRNAAEITVRARNNAMRTGEWPAIEASLVATSGPQLELALAAAHRYNPNATPEEFAEAAGSYQEPIGALTHALRLRPYLIENEFLMMWLPYEMFCSRLTDVRESLPPFEKSGVAQLGIAAPTFGDSVGGCLVYLVGLPLLFGMLVFIALIGLGGVIPIRDETGAVAGPYLLAALAVVIIADVFVFWWVKVRPKRGRGG